MEILDPDFILDLVDNQEKKTSLLRDRMDDDYDRWRLVEYSPEGDSDYAHYTSNEPKTFAGKIVGWAATAELIMRIPYAAHLPETKDKNDKKEKMAIGMLASNDERHKNRLLQ